MVSGSDDESIKIWDLRTGKIMATKTEPVGPVVDVQFSSYEMIFAAGSSDSQVYFYDFENFEMISNSEKSTAGVKSVRFSFQGDSLFALTTDAVKDFSWEPFRQKDSWPIPGKSVDFTQTQNKLITAGIKVRTLYFSKLVKFFKLTK